MADLVGNITERRLPKVTLPSDRQNLHASTMIRYVEVSNGISGHWHGQKQSAMTIPIKPPADEHVLASVRIRHLATKRQTTHWRHLAGETQSANWYHLAF